MTRVLGVEFFEGEECCAVVRADPRTYTLRVALGIVWILTPCFFFFPLLRMGLFGLLFAAVLFVSGLWYLRRLRARWYGTALVATTLRCIDVVRRRKKNDVTAVAWHDVARISVEPQRFWQRVVDVGTIRVDCVAHHAIAFVMTGVRAPERIQEFLVEVQWMRERG